MLKVQDVARYIVESIGSITTMKLEKLTYYCQAWSLAWDEEPLFEEDFQAWANGPVCPELFNEHRGLFRVEENFLESFSKGSIDSHQKETIDAVLDYYGEKAPNYLSELTHKERPWKEARGLLQNGEISDEVISKESMQEYYSGII